MDTHPRRAVASGPWCESLTRQSSTVLVTTIAARDGGVPTMLRFALPALRRMGLLPHLAYYEPYSQSPDLSAPGHALWRRRPGTREEAGIDGTPATAVGAWLPELEFTHYHPSRHWRELAAAHEHHLVISGTAIAGDALTRLGKPFVGWIATDLDGDRADRIRRFPWYRRALDASLNRHVLRRTERRVLRHGHVLALSQYTRSALNARAGADVVRDVLPSPVDTTRFTPTAATRVPGRIGFSGRLDDPRKNLPLLLDAFAIVVREFPDAELFLIGHRPGSPAEQWIRERGIAERTRLQPYVDSSQLPGLLAALDVFVVPSHQEGLCIAALEAMACGVPVVSTRCGGPEEFVLDGHTGYQTDSDPAALAQVLSRIIGNPPDRARLGEGSRRLVESHYSPARAEAVLARAMAHVFPGSRRRFSA